MTPLFWAITLLAVGVFLAIIELFIPSGGILGVTAIAALVAAVGMAFRYHPLLGLSFLASIVLLGPALAGLVLRWWPRTPMGRRFLLDVPSGDEVLPDNDQRRRLKTLIGKVGVAKSAMMPSGPVTIEGRTIDALSEGVAIAAGQRVRVIEVRGTRVLVRPTDEQPTPRDPSDPLSQPIESIGVDPFEP